jgi:putative hydrolase of the HAD superfamily
MIKAITFDYWHTLYVTQKSTDKFRSRILFLQESINSHQAKAFSLEAVEAASKVAKVTWDRTWIEEHRTIAADEWVGVVLKALEASVPPAQRLAIAEAIENSIFDDPPLLVKEAKTVIPALAEHYKLAIISDSGLTPGRVLRQLLEKDDLARYFTHFTFSDETGYSKPHPRAFGLTLAALAVEPAQAVHIGDLLRTDIAGAKRAGMRAVQYIGVNRDQMDAVIKPDAVIESHTELADLLVKWNRFA